MRLALFFIIFLTACANNSPVIVDNTSAKASLLEADKNFSRQSEANGIKNTFVDFIDSNGVLLTPNKLPVKGANAIDYLIQLNDTAFTISRKPQEAVVAASGELGYTYGIFAYQFKNIDSVRYGTYVSIWKKQRDSAWKIVLDSENDGIGDQ